MSKIDEVRLNWLGDPKNVFSYRICADSSVVVDKPRDYKVHNLRLAIDKARAVLGEIPFCPKCTLAVPETAYYAKGNRWKCEGCDTIFNWTKPAVQRNA